MKAEDIFKLLANNVLDSIGIIKDWKSASLKIQRLEKAVKFESYYTNANDVEVHIDTTANYQSSKAVHKLYEITQKHSLEHKNWNRAVFTLYPNYKFEIEYIRDQELQDRVDKYNQETNS